MLMTEKKDMTEFCCDEYTMLDIVNKLNILCECKTRDKLKKHPTVCPTAHKGVSLP